MKYDALIILGKGVTATGAIPKIVQREIDAAIRLSKKQHLPIIFSGKHSGLIEQPGKYTEAAGMKKYALSKGAARSRLFIEEQSLDTIGNAVFSKVIIDEHSWKNVLIFCTESHRARVQYIFKTLYPATIYTISYRTCKQKLSWRQRIHIRYYEWSATRFARWFLRQPHPATALAQQNWLHCQHFLYQHNWLQHWLVKHVNPPVHRKPV